MGKDKCPHCLIELTLREYKLYQNNSIVVFGISKRYDAINSTTLISYAKATFGTNIKYDPPKKSSKGHNFNSKKRINLPMMKHKYMFILANSDECKIAYPQTFIITSNMRQDTNDKMKKKIKWVLVMQ